MFHFFEAITNRSGDSLIGYYGRVIDPASNNVVTIASDDNGTPISVVSGIANMAVTDADGNLDFYVAPGTYHLDIYAPNATSLIKRVKNVAMISGIGPKGDAGDQGPAGLAANTFTSLAAFKAADTSAFKTATLVGIGGVSNGEFDWTTGNYAGQADDVDIIEADDTALSSGAWVRRSANSIVVRQRGTGSIRRPLMDDILETVKVTQFGAIGDGVSRPLSSKFSTLAAAQVMYPFATALTQTLDWAGIQSAVNYQATRAVAPLDVLQVYIPGGKYFINSSISLPNNVILKGDGLGLTSVEGGNMNAPVLLMSSAGDAYVTLRGIRFAGGTYGLRCTSAQIAGGYIENVSFEQSSVRNVEIDQLLQLVDFSNCAFVGGPGAFKVTNPTTNAVSFYNCKFVQHTGTVPTIDINGCEAVNFWGGQFEASGSVGSTVPVIQLNAAMSLTFWGTYFENLSPILLQETGSFNGVHFGGGCKFSAMKGNTGPEFKSDGYVKFGDNVWNVDARGTFNAIATGHNNGVHGRGAVRSGPSIRMPNFNTGLITIPSGSGTTVQTPAVRFSRLAGASDTCFSSGVARVTVIGNDAANGVPFCISRTFDVTVHAIGSGALQAAIVGRAATGAQFTINLLVDATPTATALRLVTQVVGINNGTPTYIAVTYDADENSVGATGAGHIFAQPVTYTGGVP